MTDLFPDDKTRWLIHNGDCLEVLKGMPDESVDSIVSDPRMACLDTRPQTYRTPCELGSTGSLT